MQSKNLYSFIFLYYFMKEFAIKSSKKKMITDCRYYDKDNKINFVVEYITRKPTWKTYVGKDWVEKNELKKTFENVFFSRSDLPKDYDNISDEEICQVLVWKSLVTQTIFTD